MFKITAISILKKNGMIGRSHLILTRKTAFLEFVFLRLIQLSVFAAEENFILSLSELFAVQENKCLTGYAVKKLKSPSLMICNHSCLRNSWCTSTNFKESSLEIGKGTYELNEHGEIGEDTELEDEQGVTFSIVQKVK